MTLDGDVAALNALLDAHRFEECLSAVASALPRTAAAVSHTTLLLRMKRLCLARLGRFTEAADAGAALLATGGGTADDRFRQAQILMRVGLHGTALPLAIQAVLEDPDGPRHLVTAVEAALMVRGGPDRLARALAPLADALDIATRGGEPESGGVLFPGAVSFCAGRLDHPSTLGLFAGASHLPVRTPGTAPRRMLWHLPALLDRAVRYRDALGVVHRRVDPAATAAFVATRLHAWTEPGGAWLLDFLSPFPVSLGQRPWIYCHDTLSGLFMPMLPVEDMTVTPDHALYWIVRAHLESSHCVRILTHCPRSLGYLADFFQSPVIAAKTVHVNTWHRTRRTATVEPEARVPRVWLFTSSFFQSDAFFRMRGGVATLIAFLVLAEEFPDIRLILRASLPASLPKPLRMAAERHPRIEHYPDPVDDATFDSLFAQADLYMMPGALIFRNGLAEALQAGIVPVVANTIGIGDFVRDGENGIVVGGLETMARLDLDPPTLVHRMAGLWAGDLDAGAGIVDALVRRLRRLHRAPDEFHRLATRNRTTVSDAVFGPADRAAFASAVRESVTLAERLHEEPVRLPTYAGGL